MSESSLPSNFSWPREAGCLLAGFLRAADADMAKLALTDRGDEMADVYRCTDRDLLLRIFAGSGQAGIEAAKHALEPEAQTCGWHWLLVPVDAGDVAIVAEYLQACGAERTNYCNFCSKEGVHLARADMVRQMFRSRLVSGEKAA